MVENKSGIVGCKYRGIPYKKEVRRHHKKNKTRKKKQKLVENDKKIK